MPKKMTNHEYIEALHRCHSDVEALEDYVNSSTKILHECYTCGNIWKAWPSYMISGKGGGCPVCNHKNAGKQKQKTTQQYIDEVATKNKNIEVIDSYCGNHTKIRHRCLIDGCVWKAEPNSILHGHGCPECARIAKSLGEEMYVKILHDTNPNVVLSGKFLSVNRKALHTCLVCGYGWNVRPKQLIDGGMCPMCSIKNRSKDHDQFVSDVYSVNPYLLVLGKYINNKTKILFKCLICGHEFMASPHSILSGTGCPMCKQSHGESLITKYLSEHQIVFNPQAVFDECKNVFCLPFDFYLPDYNVCIEYDGEQHYRPVDFFGGEDGFKKRKKNDDIKDNFCRSNNIILLRIKYDQNVNKVLDNFFKRN